MNKFFLFIIGALPIGAFAQKKLSFTDSLVNEFNLLWNKNDLKKMVDKLQDDAFFKSPYQLRYSRETMAKTVLVTNPPMFKNLRTQELFNHIEDNIGWSIGKLTGDIFDKNGHNTGKKLQSDYIYVFTRRKDNKWKLQMMVFHEK